MSSERDELAELLAKHEDCAFSASGVLVCSCGTAMRPNEAQWDLANLAAHQADVLTAAGYRKPQQVTTVEELDALPLRSIVMNDGSNPHAWQKRTDVHVGDAWYLTSDTDYGMDSYAIFEDGESATVLYVPEQTA